ncbi:phage tail protein [Methylorubrum suomiense]
MRITRISPASTKDVFRDITFESVQEVNRDAVSFPDLAVAWLTIKATDTFTSLPDFTGIYRGLVIPVPTNYTFDETTKSGKYTGIWDGSFKMAYTNNPAWHAYNFIMNSRYGKNAYYPEVADKWDYYAFGQHCDAHQLRFNEYITEPRSINELVNYIVGIAGGRYVERGDGYSTVIWDADDQVAQAIFAPENTQEGAFTYSFTDWTEQKNDFKVSFKNPELNYREDRVRVFDKNNIEVNGRNPEEFVAVGCRDPEEAVKRGRLRLATSLTERIIVSFKTNRIGRYLMPFQVILIADDQSTNVISGRIAHENGSPAGTTRLPLRDQIYLEAGITYSVQFTISDGNGGLKVVTYPLTVTTPGLQNQLVLSQALAEALPEFAVFSIGTPKAFRITGIDPDDEDPDVVDITAIEVNRLKWAFVDGKVELRDIMGVQTGPLSKFVYAPAGARITPEVNAAGQISLVTTWQPSETKLIRGYRVYQSLNGRPMELVYEGDQTTYRLERPEAGTYIQSIVAVGLDGTTESAPVTVQYIVANGTSLRSVAPPTNLRLVDEPEAPIFRAIDPRFTWDASSDPLVTKYRVEVLSPANGVVHGETISNDLQFTYSLAANRADNGGTPLRQFTVRVRSIDVTGNLSDPITLVVSHPPPAILPFSLDAVSETVFVTTALPAGDWAGTLVWMEKASGFNPLTTTPKVDARASFFPLPATTETTYYVRVAAYDSYGKTGLNYAPEQTITATNKLFDPYPPARPGKPALTTGTELGPDGTIQSFVRAVVPAVTSDNLALYEIAWQIGSGDWERRRYDTNTATMRGFLPATVVNVKALSISKAGIASSYSDVATITTTKNLVAPANPTSAAVTAGFERAIITWTAPTNVDLAVVEVWGFDGSSSAAAPPSGSRLIGTAPKGQTQFWDTLPTEGSRTYWLRSRNTSDVVSTSYVRAGVGTSAAIQGAQLAAGIVDATKFASDLAVPKVVSVLPTTRTGAFVTLASDGKLYSWDAAQGKYVTQTFNVADIKGLKADQIVSVNASALSGQIVAGQLANAAVTLANFADGLQPIVDVSVLPATADYTGSKVVRLTTDGKLYRLVSGAWTAAVPAADITGQIVGTQITNRGITTEKIAAGAITSNEIRGNTITANELAAGSVIADKIAAYAISARKIMLGATSANLIPVGEFQERLSGWTQPETSQFQIAGIGPTGTPFVRLDRGSPTGPSLNISTLGTELMPVPQGTTLAVALWVRGSAATAVSGMRVRLHWYDNTKAVLSPSFTDAFAENTPVTTGWTQIAKQITTPSTAAFMRFQLYHHTESNVQFLDFASIAIRRTTGVTLIEDGAITTDKIFANAVVAGKIAADAITAREILARSITAAEIQAGTITGNEIRAGSISADRLVANSITAAQIQAGAIGADQIAAGAIIADKIGVGLTTGNLIWNSDLAIDGWYSSVGGNQSGTSINLRAASESYAVAGTRASIQLYNGSATAGNISYFNLNFPNASNGKDNLFPIQGSKTYEFFSYLSTHRCQGYIQAHFHDGSNFLPAVSSNVIDNVPGSGAPNDTWRARLKATAPATAKFVLLRVVQTFTTTNVANGAFLIASGFYLGVVPTGTPAGVYSDYVPQSATIITGGALAANSITAREIRAGSITTDLLQAGQINVDTIAANGSISAAKLKADVLTVGNITITGGTKLSSWATGTQINGGAIAANTITAERLDIRSRGVQAVNLSFEVDKKTKTVSWNAGHILYTNDAGGYGQNNPVAGSATFSGYGWIVWVKGEDRLIGTADASPYMANPNAVIMATFDGAAGLNVINGGVIIDGTRISAGTITASQIAANAIQTVHLAANSINGDRITAGTLSVDKLAAGTITAGVVQIGPNNGQGILVMEAPGNRAGRLYCRDFNGNLRGMFGYIGDFSGVANDFGLLMWNAAGQQILTTSGLGPNTVSDVQVSSLSASKIVTNSLSALSANLGTVTAGRAQSSDGKFVIDFDNKFIEMFD